MGPPENSETDNVNSLPWRVMMKIYQLWVDYVVKYTRQMSAQWTNHNNIATTSINAIILIIVATMSIMGSLRLTDRISASVREQLFADDVDDLTPDEKRLSLSVPKFNSSRPMDMVFSDGTEEYELAEKGRYASHPIATDTPSLLGSLADYKYYIHASERARVNLVKVVTNNISPGKTLGSVVIIGVLYYISLTYSADMAKGSGTGMSKMAQRVRSFFGGRQGIKKIIFVVMLCLLWTVAGFSHL